METQMNDLDIALEYLHKVVEHSDITARFDDPFINIFTRMKTQAVADGKEKEAKMIWCYEHILQIHQSYLKAFFELKNGQYYQAWCTLERVEIELNSLARHFTQENDDEYMLDFIGRHTEQFQKVFPYKLFISPAFLQFEKKCSICGKLISIRNPCGHLKGEIYHGEECLHEVTKAEFLELSVVSNPVQKYSVLFMSDPDTKKEVDHYDYSLVKYVISGLNKPFDAWDVQLTRIRQPHSLFAHISKDDKCPCESGKIYKNCCMKASGVLRPHIKILFHVPPPDGLPEIIYPNYKKQINKP